MNKLTTLFFCAMVLSWLAVAPAEAASMSAPAGAAQASLTLSPSEPTPGQVKATVTLSGASPSALARTRLSYDTTMPSMNMAGSAGNVQPLAPGTWRFTMNLGMAAQWQVRVHFRGGVNADSTFTVAVQDASAHHSSSTTAAMPGTGSAMHGMSSMRGMASMPGMGSMQGMSSSGDSGAWRTATLALLGVVLLGALVLWRNRKPLTIGLIVLGGLLVVGVALAQSKYAAPPMDMASMESMPGGAPIPVTFATIGGDPSGTTVEAPAAVTPYLTQAIAARAPGLLTDLSAYTGDRLHAGEVVAHLSEPELQSNAFAAQAQAQAAQIEAMHHAPNGIIVARNTVQASQSDLAATQADVAAKAQQVSYWDQEIRRERELLAQGAVSQQEYQNEQAQAAGAQSAYEGARARVTSMRAQLASARTQLGDASAQVAMARASAAKAEADAQSATTTAGYTNIVVPDDAVVVKRLVDPGVYVQPGTPILQVAVVNKLRVQAQVAEQDLKGIEIGSAVDVVFSRGKTLHGRVDSISPVVDAATHTATVEAIVANDSRSYQPGGYVRAIIHATRAIPRRSFTVPSQAIVGGATTAVWTDRDGSAHRVGVIVVSDDGTSAQIEGDLHPGERIVVTGGSSLEEGQAIAGSVQ